MKRTSLALASLIGTLFAASVTGVPRIASADTTSTAAIIAGAAAIAGALIYDSQNHPYYIRDRHRYYVTDEQARWYKQHHHGSERRAYVPEQEYPPTHAYNQRDDHQGDQARRDNR
jgi:hypothetical protein